MAFSEVNEIINIMPDELAIKIPKGFKDIVAEEKDDTYMPNIHEPIENNKFKDETIIILGLMYRDFLCSKEEREILQKKDKEELQEIEEKLEKELKEKYNVDNLFKKSEDEIENNTNEVALVEVKEEKWYKKIFAFFRRIFGTSDKENVPLSKEKSKK